jgi:hypothetical protein
MKLPAILTRFAVSTGDMDPELVTRSVILQPTRILKKGQLREAPRPPVVENSWEIETPKRTLYSLDESMAELLSIVWPKREEIVSFCQARHLQCLFITVAWADDEHRPIYELSRESLKKIGALNASWIMDLV